MRCVKRLGRHYLYLARTGVAVVCQRLRLKMFCDIFVFIQK